jgi:hypothetical protein
MAEQQNYQNHVRRVPGYVTAVFLVLIANVLWSGYRMVTALSIDTVMYFLVSLCLVMLGFIARTQTLTVQNRVIRLEQRLRFHELLPRDIAARAAALPIAQIVALRFASDAELPGLVNDVLAGQVQSSRDIKLKVKDWQGDFLRA